MAHITVRTARRVLPLLTAAAIVVLVAPGHSAGQDRGNDREGKTIKDRRDDHDGRTIKLATKGPRKPPRRPSSTGPSSDQARGVMRAQAPLLVAAKQIERVAARTERRGLGGIEVSVANREVLLYWKGRLPVPVAREIKRRSFKTPVRVLPARYTKNELQRQASKLVRDAKRYPDMHRVSVLPDGSGLEVGVASGRRAGAFQHLPVAIRVQVEEPFEPFQCKTVTPYCRIDDTPAFWGGASAVPVNGSSCSDAFATAAEIPRLEVGPFGPIFVRDRFMLTAEHCGGGVGVSYFAGSGPPMGRGARVNRNVDSMAILTNSAPRIYDGGVNDGSEFSKPVVDLGTNVSGGFVCSSGASSGVHCGIMIKNTGTSLDWGDHWSHDVVIADQVDGVLAAGDGDSGGPVFALSDDPSKVVGMGVIIGGGKQADFPAACTYRSTVCSTRLFYTDLLQVLIKQGLLLIITS